MEAVVWVGCRGGGFVAEPVGGRRGGRQMLLGYMVRGGRKGRRAEGGASSNSFNIV